MVSSIVYGRLLPGRWSAQGMSSDGEVVFTVEAPTEEEVLKKARDMAADGNANLKSACKE